MILWRRLWRERTSNVDGNDETLFGGLESADTLTVGDLRRVPGDRAHDQHVNDRPMTIRTMREGCHKAKEEIVLQARHRLDDHEKHLIAALFGEIGHIWSVSPKIKGT